MPKRPKPTTEADYTRLREIRDELARVDDLYVERLAIFQRLSDAGEKQATIAAAAGVKPVAVGVALHKARRKGA